MVYFRWWPMLPAMGLLRPVAEISVNSIVHLTLYSFIVSGFMDALFGNVLIQAVLDPIFMALQKRQCPVFSCQVFLEYIYMFVPSLSNSLLTVIRKSMLLNGNPHSETVNKCSTISHSTSFERTVG